MQTGRMQTLRGPGALGKMGQNNWGKTTDAQHARAGSSLALPGAGTAPALAYTSTKTVDVASAMPVRSFHGELMGFCAPVPDVVAKPGSW